MSRAMLLLMYLEDRLFGWLHTLPHEQAMSQVRVNREIKNQELHHMDEAALKCMARVKRRMRLGVECKEPPMIKRNSDAETANSF